MQKLIGIEDLINNIDNYLIIDLRSPLEYEQGTILNAINIPLLDNEARKIVGTLYKEDQKEAYREGLKVGMSRLPVIFDQILKLKEEQPSKEIVLFCFRGGTRSKSVQAMLEVLNIHTYKLDGGYKAYRRYVIVNLPLYLNKINWLVLTGNTGCGKTLILQRLLNEDYPVVDLENHANHRGSVFGSLGLGSSVSQCNFESNLFLILKKYVDNNITNIFIECESKKIGNISLPKELYDKMQISPHILINVSIDRRVEIISKDYGSVDIDDEQIKEIIKNNQYFKVVLGNKWVDGILGDIEQKDYNTFVRKMLLDYYDKLYSHSQSKYTYDLAITSDSENEIIAILKEYYNKK